MVGVHGSVSVNTNNQGRFANSNLGVSDGIVTLVTLEVILKLSRVNMKLGCCGAVLM